MQYKDEYLENLEEKIEECDAEKLSAERDFDRAIGKLVIAVIALAVGIAFCVATKDIWQSWDNTDPIGDRTYGNIIFFSTLALVTYIISQIAEMHDSYKCCVSALRYKKYLVQKKRKYLKMKKMEALKRENIETMKRTAKVRFV